MKRKLNPRNGFLPALLEKQITYTREGKLQEVNTLFVPEGGEMRNV
jgi:hypothetical protein